jgi:hypothetical protein
VLIRARVGTSLAAVRALKKAGRAVYVSWKESGRNQIAGQLRWFWRRSALRRVLAEADGAIAVTEHAAEHYRVYGCTNIVVLPTPYPVDVAAWDFTAKARRGIFIGTREFDVPGRRHAQALALAAELAKAANVRVTVMNFDGPKARARIEQLLAGVKDVRILEERLDYPGYLREMAQHRLVLQLDDGEVPGQVAGDALLCRVVNAGGNGAIQRVAFREFALTDGIALRPLALRLLTDEAYYLSALSRAAANDSLSPATACARSAGAAHPSQGLIASRTFSSGTVLGRCRSIARASLEQRFTSAPLATPEITGTDGPCRLTERVPSAAARCVTPVSQPTRNFAPASTRASCVRFVGGSTSPPNPAAMRSPAARSAAEPLGSFTA